MKLYLIASALSIPCFRRCLVTAASHSANDRITRTEGGCGQGNDYTETNRSSVIDFYFAGASIASSRSGVSSTLSKCG